MLLSPPFTDECLRPLSFLYYGDNAAPAGASTLTIFYLESNSSTSIGAIGTLHYPNPGRKITPTLLVSPIYLNELAFLLPFHIPGGYNICAGASNIANYHIRHLHRCLHFDICQFFNHPE